MATKQSTVFDPATHRTVVMLRSKERQRLDKLALAENVSGGEIIRRAITAYDPERDKEESLLPLVELWRGSTERAIKAVDHTLAEVKKIRKQVKVVLN